MAIAFEQLEYDPDAESASELAAIARRWTPAERAAYLASFPTLSSWLDGMGHMAQLEIRRVVGRYFEGGAGVLDIGVGSGRSTLLLRELGLGPTAVEPVPEMCAMLAEACDRFGEPRPRTICGPAEELGQLLPAEEFGYDGAVFNSSFHHLRDPMIALRHLRTLVRPGGVVALVNEPHRPFIARRARFRKNLIGEPDDICGYAGNERVYRNGEYVAMLRAAGFSDISVELNVRNTDYATVLKQLATKTDNGRPVFNTRQLLLRAVAFGLVTELSQQDALRRLLQSTSVVMSSYIGYVPK